MPAFKNIEERNAQRRKNYRNGKVHDYRSRMSWSQEDVRLIHNSHARGFTDRELAWDLARSVQAIQVKRSKTKGMFR